MSADKFNLSKESYDWAVDFIRKHGKNIDGFSDPVVSRTFALAVKARSMGFNDVHSLALEAACFADVEVLAVLMAKIDDAEQHKHHREFKRKCFDCKRFLESVVDNIKYE